MKVTETEVKEVINELKKRHLRRFNLLVSRLRLILAEERFSPN